MSLIVGTDPNLLSGTTNGDIFNGRTETPVIDPAVNNQGDIFGGTKTPAPNYQTAGFFDNQGNIYGVSSGVLIVGAIAVYILFIKGK